MSTRSQIGLYDSKKGTVEYIYCHWDGYTNEVGQRLLGFYNTEQKVRELLRHGDLSSLKNSPELSDFSGEPSTTIKASSVEGAALALLGNSIEYAYVFDVDKGAWVYTSDKMLGSLVKPIPKNINAPAWSDCVTRKDAENDVLDILSAAGGKYVLSQGKKLHAMFNHDYIGVTSVETQSRSNNVIIHDDEGKTIKMSDMSGYDVCLLAQQMYRSYDDVVKSERRNRFNHSRRNESFNSMVSNDTIVSKDDLAHALCGIIECNAFPRDLIGNWSVFVNGDLTSFPVWCYTDDRTGKIMFGISKLKSYILNIDEDDIDDAISMEHLDDSFTRNEIRELAGNIVDGYLFDENSYDAGFVSPKGMKLELPITGRELYNLLERADEFYADIQEDLTEILTDGICRNLGIGSWQDDRDVIDSLADERVCLRKERRSMKRFRSRR